MKKSALVTGANKGIGYALAKALIEHGYDVWIGARSPDLGEAAARALGGRFVALDVTDPASVAAAVQTYRGTSDALDLLVNNAGVGGVGNDGNAAVAAVDDIRRVLEVNLLGAISVTQAFLPLLRRAGNAHVLNVSSGMGSSTLWSDPESPLHRYPTKAGYCASKAALNMYTVLLANELRAEGIRVNSVCPGSVMTDMTKNIGAQTPDASASKILPFLSAEGFLTGQFAQAEGTYPW